MTFIIYRNSLNIFKKQNGAGLLRNKAEEVRTTVRRLLTI
jgi:hypothetical protein